MERFEGDSVAEDNAYQAQLDAANLKQIGIFNVRIVKAGDLYGLRDCLKHEGAPMIEFYDARQKSKSEDWKVRGQFVSRYYISTLKDHNPAFGLDLHGGIEDWQVSAEQLAEAMEYAETQA